MLSEINRHPRDEYISFEEKEHKYTISGRLKAPTSVTTLIHKYFPEFNADLIISRMMSGRNWPQSKYYGKSRETIKREWDESGKEAARLGTLMHKNIELFINSLPVDNPDTKEFSMFRNFWHDFFYKYPSVTPYRTEWLVYDEDTDIAGSIDLVLRDPNGNLILGDWKRSKEIKPENKYEKGLGPFSNYHNCNYFHYALQLNFYRHILETKYGQTVIFMMLIILHPDQQSYLCYPVNRIDLSGIWKYLN